MSNDERLEGYLDGEGQLIQAVNKLLVAEQEIGTAAALRHNVAEQLKLAHGLILQAVGETDIGTRMSGLIFDMQGELGRIEAQLNRLTQMIEKTRAAFRAAIDEEL